jgi:23S rRNA (uridine2552-2'-O)-methyltransferase
MAGDSYRKPDFWARKAKEEGYPARSVYKLKEMDEKFRLLKPGARVLDLGAAPGSWSAYSLGKIGPRGFLAAIDLAPLALDSPAFRASLGPRGAAPNFFFLQGDLYDEANRRALEERGPFGLVMSDAAPSTTGNALVDRARSEDLVEAAVSYARAFLAPSGAFVAKLFQGGAQEALLKSLRAEYGQARGFKPQACRSESFEMYLVATDKRA